jgi:hypothetical protein
MSYLQATKALGILFREYFFGTKHGSDLRPEIQTACELGV